MVRLLAAVVAMAAPVHSLCAQGKRPDSARVTPTSSRGRLPVAGCAGQPISNIVIITQPPYTDRLPRRFEFLRRAARRLHSVTDDEVIRRYLLLRAGEPCNQIRRAESERVLRAQPFLVDARIRVYEDGVDSVRLEIETRDEFSAIFEPTISAVSPIMRGLRVGDGNLAGSARLAAVEWREGLAYHDVFGAQYNDYQFGGDRNELRVLAQRNPRGQQQRLEIVRPFYTDLQRFAFLGSIDGTRDFAGFRRVGEPGNAVNMAQTSAVVGGITRIGSVGRLKLVGLSMTHSRTRVDSTTVVIDRAGFLPDTGTPLGVQFRQQNVVRLNALGGIRLLRFTPAQGFDALTGAQDLRIGLQVGAVYGHSLGIGAARDRDRFMASGLYAGVGGPSLFFGAQFLGEARNDRGNKTWDDHIVSGRMALYFHPAVRQLSLLSAEWSEGRDMRKPFQLSLADRNGGLMGHRRSQDAGAQRLVLRAEQRMVIPSRLNVADVGIGVFAEAGKLWGESSVPYSQTTPWRGAAGVSIMAAVPPRSRRLWRLDLAMPMGSDKQKRFEVRITNEDRTRVFWREPRDVTTARERTVPSSLFTWP